MPEISQTERVLKILQILSNGSHLTTAELVRRFDGLVSPRTVQRDLKLISNTYTAIRSRKISANENEWFLDPRFRSLVPQTLGLNEYLAAHMLKENLKIFRNTEFSDEIDSLLEKIDQIVPEDVFLETDDSDPEGLFENYTAGLFDYTGYDDIINRIIQAIIQSRKSFVSYYNAYEQKSKNFYVEPRRIVYFKGGLYVIVYVRRFESFRLLAVQRIRKFKIQDEVFETEPVFDADRYWEKKFGLFSAEHKQVTLIFSPDVRMHIEGRHWHGSQKFSEGTDGSLILEMEVGLSPELVSWIFSWNEFVEVIGPAELIGAMSEKIEKLNKLYPH